MEKAREDWRIMISAGTLWLDGTTTKVRKDFIQDVWKEEGKETMQ